MATRIWGGDSAEDRWGIYINSDTEAPTTPTNVTLNNISLNAITVSRTASTDNIGVTGYNVYLDGILTTQTTNTSATITDLNTNTTYSFTVVAKDLINNRISISLCRVILRISMVGISCFFNFRNRIFNIPF